MPHMSRLAYANTAHRRTDGQNERRPICAGRASHRANLIYVMCQIWPGMGWQCERGMGAHPLERHIHFQSRARLRRWGDPSFGVLTFRINKSRGSDPVEAPVGRALNRFSRPLDWTAPSSFIHNANNRAHDHSPAIYRQSLPP